MTCCCAEHAGAFEMLDRTCPNCPQHHTKGLNPDTLRRQADFLDGKGSESTADSLRQRAEIIELKRLLEEAYGLIMAVDSVSEPYEAMGGLITIRQRRRVIIPVGWFDKTNDLLARIREVAP